MKYIVILITLSITLFGCSLTSRANKDDYDPAKAVYLIAQAVPHPAVITAQENGSDPGTVPDSNVIIHPLFTQGANFGTNMEALSSVIDPVGTSLADDYDGDGVTNANETASNVWVADYPLIEASIATPVTLKIEILKDSGQTIEQLSSNINSDDMENTIDQGTEKIHQTEVNTRTVQFQDSFSASDGDSKGTGAGSSTASNSGFTAKIPVQAGLTLTAGGSSSRSKSQGLNTSWANETGFAATVTKWANIPFQNNIERNVRSLKSDNAAGKSRKYRQDFSKSVDINTEIKSNAGYIRAALYLENHSINMPVHISNVLCSFMFETPTGELIPVQSFRLRNDDYTLFSTDVYGGEKFGPYVVELKNLNTVEIEKAITLGYNPKIFIIDYQMTHVEDSNYRGQLSNYNGNNVKIVEENAKGRTALIKLFAPGRRELFRVAAFSAENIQNRCRGDVSGEIKPGVSLKEALERISCSGYGIEFENYLLNLGEIAPGLKTSKVFVPTIKSFAGIENRVPCTPQTETGNDGITRTACVQKPFSEWTQAESENFGIWLVFSRSGHYNHSEYQFDGNQQIHFKTPGPGEQEIPLLKGVNSMMWVGDHFDLVYFQTRDIKAIQKAFGTNPLETEEVFRLNTRWDLSTLNGKPFYPDRHSRYLGVAALGDKVELTFNLKKTDLLNPDFGQLNPAEPGPQIMDTFSYNQVTSDRRYTLSEALDFEISLGLGGKKSDWYNLLRDTDGTVSGNPTICGTEIDVINQKFILCVNLPSSHPLVTDGKGLVNLFLRSSLNNAYRNSIWPLPAAEVRSFKGIVAESVAAGSVVVKIKDISGELKTGDTLTFSGDNNSYAVQSFSTNSNLTTINITSGLVQDLPQGVESSVNAGLSESNFVYLYREDFFQELNNDINPLFHNFWDVEQLIPLAEPGTYSTYCPGNSFSAVQCLGYESDFMVANWLGFNNYGDPYWNNWADASKLIDIVKNSHEIFNNNIHEFFMEREFALGWISIFNSDSVMLSDYNKREILHHVTLNNDKALVLFNPHTSQQNVIHTKIINLDDDSVINVSEPIFRLSDIPDKPGQTNKVFLWQDTRIEKGDSVSTGLAITGVQYISGGNSIIEHFARRIDLSTGQPIGNIVRLFDGGSVYSQNNQDLKRIFQTYSSGDYAVTLLYIPNRLKFFAVISRISTGEIIKGLFEFPVALNQLHGPTWKTPIALNSSKVVFAATTGPNIQVVVVDIASGAIQGPYKLNSLSYSNVATASVSLYQNRAFVSWFAVEGQNPTIVKVRGRFLNVDTGVPEGSVETRIADLTPYGSGTSYYIKQLQIQDKALVFWADLNRVHMKNINAALVDMKKGIIPSPESHPDLRYKINGSSLSQATYTGFLQSTSYGDKALMTWSAQDPDGWKFYGRVLNTRTQKFLGKEIPIIKIPNVNGYNYQPMISNNGKHAIVHYTSSNSSRVAAKLKLNYAETPLTLAPNNFFTAPLIEREYEVQARILTELQQSRR